MGENKCPVLPRSHLVSLTQQLHAVLGHTGRDNVLSVMRCICFHPSMSDTVARVVLECAVCQSFKGNTCSGFPLQRRTAERPYEVYAIDLMDMPRTPRGYWSVLVGVDRLTRFADVVMLRNKTSRLVAEALESHILSSVSITPETILSDGGPEFRSRVFMQMLERYCINHERTIPFRPHTNGGVERINRTIKERLAIVSDERAVSRDKIVYEVVSQYNRTLHAETVQAPANFFNLHLAQPNLSFTTVKGPLWQQATSRCKIFHHGDLVMRKVTFNKPGQSAKLCQNSMARTGLKRCVAVQYYTNWHEWVMAWW